MKRIGRKAEQLPYVSPELFRGGEAVIMSYDNPAIHKAAAEELEAAGFDQKDKLFLPEYSPDIHKVVEHVHGQIKQEFRRRLAKDTRLKSPEQMVRLLKSVFNGIKAESIKKDVLSLYATFDAIIEADGDFVCKALS